jgi:hypothetical protein
MYRLTDLLRHACLLAIILCAGCAAVGTGPAAPAAGGTLSAPVSAAFCASSPDGTVVACDGAAQFCDHSSDGKMVACGGRARS